LIGQYFISTVKIKVLQTSRLNFWHKLSVHPEEFLTKNEYSPNNLTIMRLFLLNSSPKDLHQKPVSKLLVPVYEPLQHPNDDSELPHEAIRHIDQPPVYTEGCIAAGCPEDLW
jgi:hypothetical protein